MESLIEELAEHMRSYTAGAVEAAETIRKIALLLAVGEEFTYPLAAAMARHESAVLELNDLALEATDRLYARAQAARARAKGETSPPASSVREVATE